MGKSLICVLYIVLISQAHALSSQVKRSGIKVARIETDNYQYILNCKNKYTATMIRETIRKWEESPNMALLDNVTISSYGVITFTADDSSTVAIQPSSECILSSTKIK